MKIWGHGATGRGVWGLVALTVFGVEEIQNCRHHRLRFGVKIVLDPCRRVRTPLLRLISRQTRPLSREKRQLTLDGVEKKLTQPIHCRLWNVCPLAIHHKRDPLLHLLQSCEEGIVNLFIVDSTPKATDVGRKK